MIPSFEALQALQEVATQIGASLSDLSAVIAFESNWDPQAKNPYSSARGLIQFMDATAQQLGFRDSADLVAQYPDAASQLRGPVLAYFRPHAPYPTLQSLAMQVFYPAARAIPPDTAFPDTVQRVNPGIVTVQDYLNKVLKKKDNSLLAKATEVAISGGVIFLASLAFFLMVRPKKL